VAELTFYTLDVFTERRFGGNQLAVFPDAPDLAADVMQAIAREFNISETVFVRPPTIQGALRKLRIFTPGAELPFAGHPTVGTAQLLVELGVAPHDGSGAAQFAFEEGVGLVPVTVTQIKSGGFFTWLTAARVPESLDGVPSRALLAKVLGLEADEILETPSDAPCIYSAGVPFVFIPVRDLDVLARAQVDLGAWRASLRGSPAEDLYVFCNDPSGDADIRARMFAPAMGIAEDPATGGAAAAFGGYLARRQGSGGRWIIAQGVEMGRPSTLHVDVAMENGTVSSVRVGGSAVRVSRGVMTI
jgi:trans-2,3-dihydro-3-hydroxyanthranilate isomerase